MLLFRYCFWFDDSFKEFFLCLVETIGHAKNVAEQQTNDNLEGKRYGKSSTYRTSYPTSMIICNSTAKWEQVSSCSRSHWSISLYRKHFLFQCIIQMSWLVQLFFCKSTCCLYCILHQQAYGYIALKHQFLYNHLSLVSI